MVLDLEPAYDRGSVANLTLGASPEGTVATSATAPAESTAPSSWQRLLDAITHARGDLEHVEAYSRSSLDLLASEVRSHGKGAVLTALVKAGVARADADDLVSVASRSRRGDKRLLTFDDVLRLPEPTALVENFLDRSEVVLLYGETGSFKTFVALDLSVSVATGTTWLGRQVDTMPVVYMVGEGLSGMRVRLAAIQSSRSDAEMSSLRFLRDVPNLLSDDEVDRLVFRLARLKPGLVVVDTLAMGMPGADENSARDMGLAAGNLRHLAKTLDCAVIVVHHPVKSGGTTERGSGALKAAVDAAYLVRATGRSVTIESMVQRNRAATPRLRVDLVPCEESLVVTHAGTDEVGWDDDEDGEDARMRPHVAQIVRALGDGIEKTQTELLAAITIQGRRMKEVREYLMARPDLGVSVVRHGNSYRYSLTPAAPSPPPPPKGGGEEGI